MTIKTIPLLLFIFCFVLLVFVGAPVEMFAQEQSGVLLLEPIDGFLASEDSPRITSLSIYLDGAYRLGIAVASGLAVIMIALGGIEYMTTGSISKKAEGRERIFSAIWGLLLALGSFVILQTINPAFTQNSLSDMLISLIL